MALTDREIKNAKPREKRYTMFDTGGLYLEVAPAGGKWWRLRYRFNGKSCCMSLGVYPEVTLKAARDKRDKFRTMLAAGENPKFEKQQQSPTFSDILAEWFEFKKEGWSPKTIKDAESVIRNHLNSNLGKMPIDKLTIQDFITNIRSIKSNIVARHLAQICKQVMRYARILGLVVYNPITEINEIIGQAQIKHYPIITDPEKLGKLVYDLKNNNSVSSSIKNALRIMPYVFVRSTELCSAKWCEFNFETATWLIPAERMKMKRPHLVPLAHQVAEWFKEQKQHTGDSEFCFTNRNNQYKAIPATSLLDGLRMCGYTRDKICIHSFRGIASTVLNEKGFRADVIERQLAHAEKSSVRAAYNHAEYLEERRQMMQWWADYLDELAAEYADKNAVYL